MYTLQYHELIESRVPDNIKIKYSYVVIIVIRSVNTSLICATTKIHFLSAAVRESYTHALPRPGHNYYIFNSINALLVICTSVYCVT